MNTASTVAWAYAAAPVSSISCFSQTTSCIKPAKPLKKKAK